MNSKDKENLSYLYELDQYKSLVKLVKNAREKIANQLLNVDVREPMTVHTLALLQGQALALYSLMVDIEKIHKQSTKES